MSNNAIPARLPLRKPSKIPDITTANDELDESITTDTGAFIITSDGYYLIYT